MRSIAVSVVRNCQDVITLTVLQHILLGVDRCVVIDNGSTDGTMERLRAIARKVPRLEVRSDPSDFRPHEQMNAVVNDALRGQRMLVIPFDADECWHAPVSAVARRMVQTGDNVLSCPVVNFIQSRSVSAPTRFGWSLAFRRIATPYPYDMTRVVERRCSFVELAYPRKVLFCADGPVSVMKGNHGVDFPGKKIAECNVFPCLHLPLRTKLELETRAFDFAPRMLAARSAPIESWQAGYFRDAVMNGGGEAEWRANSYGHGGLLDVFGTARPTVVDFRLVSRMWRAYAYGLYLGIPMGARPRKAN